ncbi:MAG: DUF4145 domain-containing protein [Deltaproteobacteria bacterium]|nr:DUF4145 domain-containing protein [Deltaproteobacteria bacterium]
MELLIISDFLEKPESNDIDKFERIDWESQSIGPLSHYDAIIVDMPFRREEKGKVSRNTQRLLYDLSRRLPDSNSLDDGPTIIVVICSSEEKAFNEDNRPDEHASPEDWESEPFASYEFLKQIMSDHKKNCYYEEIKYRFITPLTPSTSYLSAFKDNVSYLSYNYSNEKEECSFIKPLAKAKKDSRKLASFECIVGRGLIIVLPAYNLDKKDMATNELIKMCKVHHNQRYMENSLDVFEKIDSENLRRLFEEAYLCFKHGLYIATVIMCRRVLEESLTEKGADDPNDKLKKKINKMFSKGYITRKQCDIGHLVREFGNDGAHYRKEFVTEVKAYDALQFLEYYFTAEHQREHILKSKKGE